MFFCHVTLKVAYLELDKVVPLSTILDENVCKRYAEKQDVFYRAINQWMKVSLDDGMQKGIDVTRGEIPVDQVLHTLHFGLIQEKVLI